MEGRVVFSEIRRGGIGEGASVVYLALRYSMGSPIPTKVGIQNTAERTWIPAFAGMGSFSYH